MCDHLDFVNFCFVRTVDFEKAVERFVLSCAGYCVATFVLVSQLTEYNTTVF
jgi:hypothetical protein